MIYVRDGDVFRYQGVSRESRVGRSCDYLRNAPARSQAADRSPGRMLLSGEGRADSRYLARTRNIACRSSPRIADARACSACRCYGKDGESRALSFSRGSSPGHFSAAPDRDRANLRRPGRHRHRKRAAVRRSAGAHARTRSLARRSAQGAGPARAIGKARLARPAHRRHRPRDQEPAQFRQQFLRAVARAARRDARDARQGDARRGANARRPTS